MITYEERRAVYVDAILHYGEGRQILKAIEEMAELTNELAKSVDLSRTSSDRIVDEIADVLVMMEQLCLIYGVNEEVQDRIDYKVRRLLKRLKEEGRDDTTDQTDREADGDGQDPRGA